MLWMKEMLVIGFSCKAIKTESYSEYKEHLSELLKKEVPWIYFPGDKPMSTYIDAECRIWTRHGHVVPPPFMAKEKVTGNVDGHDIRMVIVGVQTTLSRSFKD
ncbi:hypothetical protein R1flu_010122 [Riccia fluitans]|uniref:Uncharacterized protein n=1 Tax=Riccia fluitans TaxID=41844 RepID=A0ABD1Z490_9MARC